MENISFSELLQKVIKETRTHACFLSLYSLLHALIKYLDIEATEIQCGEHRHICPGASRAGGQQMNQSHTQSCEALILVQKLQIKNGNIEEEIKELQQLKTNIKKEIKDLQTQNTNLNKEIKEFKQKVDTVATQNIKVESSSVHVLNEEMSSLCQLVHRMQEDMKHTKDKLCKLSATNQLQQSQLDDQQGMLEDLILSLTSYLHSGHKDKDGDDDTKNQKLAQGRTRSSFTNKTEELGRKLRHAFQQFEQLQENMSLLLQQQLEMNVKKTIWRLQTESEKAKESTTSLHEENRQHLRLIKELYKMMAELEKSNRHVEETKCKGNESALEDKVKHIVPEELNSISNKILNKVTSRERNCYKNNLSMETESSHDDLELLRKCLEDRWHEIHQEILAKGLLERSVSLSDGGHDAVKCIPGQHVHPPTPVALPCKSTLRPVAQHHNYKGDFIRKKDAQMSLNYSKDNLDKAKSKAKDALTDKPAAKTKMSLCYGQMNSPAAGKNPQNLNKFLTKETCTKLQTP